MMKSEVLHACEKLKRKQYKGYWHWRGWETLSHQIYKTIHRLDTQTVDNVNLYPDFHLKIAIIGLIFLKQKHFYMTREEVELKLESAIVIASVKDRQCWLTWTESEEGEKHGEKNFITHSFLFQLPVLIII